MQTKNNAGSAPAVDDDMDEAPILTDAEAGEVEVFEGSAFVRRGRGRPPTGNAKELVSLRLDREVLAKLRAHGPGWQSQVNGLLRIGLGLDTVAVLVGTPSVSKTPGICSLLSGDVLPDMTGSHWVDPELEAHKLAASMKAKNA